MRNFETSKDRCERIYHQNQANLLRQTFYDSKKLTRDGNFLRPKITMKEKHMPLKLAEVGETARIRDAVQERGNVSLRESFNANLYENPVWKSVDKQKWRSARGMSYEGQLANHVNTQRQTLLGGTGLVNTAMAQVMKAKGKSGTWSVVKNEDPEGSNPYSGGHADISQDLVSRKRNLYRERQISPKPFNSQTRASKRMDDKVAAPTLNQMNAAKLTEMLQRKVIRNSQTPMDLALNDQETISVIEEERQVVHSTR